MLSFSSIIESLLLFFEYRGVGEDRLVVVLAVWRSGCVKCKGSNHVS
ncbi:hypothetical protein M6B38_402675 [Iris pallida]|uniref:Uncharacterized protein n=1 Tax=Iris pallida TaxID=29817 RepID=A0AAX6FSK8_IRIPA|nr:hypothetical protein M6B38_402675 [Iris pallida]